MSEILKVSDTELEVTIMVPELVKSLEKENVPFPLAVKLTSSEFVKTFETEIAMSPPDSYVKEPELSKVYRESVKSTSKSPGVDMTHKPWLVYVLELWNVKLPPEAAILTEPVS